MKKIFHIFVALLLFTAFQWVYGATCSLNTTPAPPVQSYEENVDKVLEAARKLASKASCARDGSSGGSLSVGGRKIALDKVQASEYDIWNLLQGNSLYNDASNKMLLPKALEHDKYIINIQQKILAATAEIGSRCAGDMISFDEDVSLNNALYRTNKRTLQEVMNHMYTQTSEVSTFYRYLATNTRNNEYIDESKFSVAPEGFSDDMREFYSPENIQKCYDEDPKKQKIQETQKAGLAEALKYPQAVNIWKNAFQLLLYGKDSQPQGNENPTSTVHAKKWGLWNSLALLKDLIKEKFSYPGGAASTEDKGREIAKQNAYGWGAQPSTSLSTTGAEFEQSFGGKSAPVSAYQANKQWAETFVQYLQELSQAWKKNGGVTFDNEENNIRSTAALVNTMEAYIEAQKTSKEIVDKVCEAYDNRHATNLWPSDGKPECSTFFDNGHGEAMEIRPGGVIDDAIWPRALIPNDSAATGYYGPQN